MRTGQMDHNDQQGEEANSVGKRKVDALMSLKAVTRTIFVCATLLQVAGCASKIFQHPLLVTNPSEPSAEVYFFREDVFWSSGIATPVHVNGETLLQLRRATYANVSLKPGTYQVEVRPIAGAQPGNPWRTCGGSMDFEAGKAYFVLLNFVGGEAGMCFRPELITEEGARSLMTTYDAVHQ